MKNKKLGRPQQAVTKSEWIQIRATTAQKKRCKAAAKRDKRTLSNWFLNLAEREIKGGE